MSSEGIRDSAGSDLLANPALFALLNAAGLTGKRDDAVYYATTMQSPMNDDKKEQIQARLTQIETEQDVRILYAVESGSRAWGFASPDSDYDVRFIYARPVKEYLRVSPRRDVLELPIECDLDINGWDIFKTLALFRKSNPPLLEWLASPIIYREESDFAAELRQLARTHASPRRMAYHYLSMANGNWKDYIADRPEVFLKKYLYVLRPMACILWMEQNGTPPPTSFTETLAGIELAHELRTKLSELLQQKRQAGEMGKGAADPTLNAFLSAEMTRIQSSVADLPDERMDDAILDRLAWKELGLT